MSEVSSSPAKSENTISSLSWLTVCLWTTALFVLHYYVLSRFDVLPQSYPVLISIIMFLTIAVAFYIAALLISLVIMRRLPRAMGPLICLSIFYAVNLIIVVVGPSGNRPPPIQAEKIGAVSHPKKARIINHEAAGNLQSNHRVGCISISSAKRVFTPSDLYKGVALCMVEKNIDAGVRLHALAGVYGFYDTLRVADKTSHQALLVLQMQAFNEVPTADKRLFSDAAKQTFQDETKIAEVCSEIRHLGPPDYDPIYMIQHGMGAFNSDAANTRIVAGFDQESSWEKALTTFLHCPASAT